jgi:hypothetical protein
MNTTKISNLTLTELKIYKDEIIRNLEKYEKLMPSNLGHSLGEKEYKSQFNKWRTIFEAFENEMNKRIETFI